MKTRRQKVFAILVACLLCASFFVIPVSAANVSSSSFELPIPTYVEDDIFFRVGLASNSFDPINSFSWNDLNPPNDILIIGSSSNPGGVTYEFSNPDPDFSTGAISFWIGQSSYNLTRYGPNNIFWIDPGVFTLEVLPDSNLRLSRYRFSLRIIESNGVIGNVIATTPVNRLYIDGDSEYWAEVEYPGLEFTFDTTSNGLGLLLCLDVLYDSSRSTSSTNSVSLYKDVFTVYGSDGPDPNLPQYSPPDQGSIGEVDDLESDILDGSQDGLDSVSGQLDSSSLTEAVTDFQWAFVHISRFMTRLSGNIPYLDAVIYISISLGLLSTLVGLSGAIVTASDRRGKGSKVKSSKNKKE